MNRYKLAINEEACWGCRTCEVACKQELNVPEGVQLIKVVEDGPRAVDDKIVILDQDKCTGCGLCVDECPYNAISLHPESGLAYKCNLCFQRIGKGLIPACADNVCLAHCISFEAQ